MRYEITQHPSHQRVTPNVEILHFKTKLLTKCTEILQYGVIEREPRIKVYDIATSSPVRSSLPVVGRYNLTHSKRGLRSSLALCPIRSLYVLFVCWHLTLFVSSERKIIVLVAF